MARFSFYKPKKHGMKKIRSIFRLLFMALFLSAMIVSCAPPGKGHRPPRPPAPPGMPKHP